MKLNVRNRNKGTDKPASWEYRFEIAKVGGKRKQFSKGGFRTKKEAETAGMKAINEYNQTGLLENASELSFSDFIDIWLEQYAKSSFKESTYYSTESRINKFIRPALGNYKIKKMSPLLIQGFLNDLYANPNLSEGTKKLIKKNISQILKYAVVPCGFLQANPAQYIKAPKCAEGGRTVQRYVYSSEQIQTIVNDYGLYSPFSCAVLIAYNTGLRCGEVVALTWDDIDLKKKTISVSKNSFYKRGEHMITTPKSQKSVRTVMIGTSLCRYLKDYQVEMKKNEIYYGEYYTHLKLENGLVCPSNERIEDFIIRRENGQYIGTNTIDSSIREASKRVGFDINFHSFRHTHATRLIEAGVSPKVVQERLGHSDITITLNKYVHVTEMMQQTAVDVFEKCAF